jgi:hypothetical protein
MLIAVTLPQIYSYHFRIHHPAQPLSSIPEERHTLNHLSNGSIILEVGGVRKEKG